MPAPPSPPLTNVPGGGEEEDNTYNHVPVNKGKYPPLGVLTGLYEKLSNENKHELRRKLLANWFRKWRKDVGPDLYPVLRLLLPQKDRERAVYNIKEKTLARIYIRIIPLNPKDEDAVRLMNWKKPTEKDKAAGDFPMVLYEVVSKRSNVMEGSLTIERLNKLLDELAKAGGKMDEQTNIITTIYNNCTPAEQRWIVRIILKDLTISVKETTVFSVFHEDAMALFNTCSDLKRIAYELSDPTKRLDADDKTVKLFRAFAPMLCKRPTKRIEDTVKLMGGEKFIIEEKLDGERMQLHKQGNEYFYCSRKGKDYTYLYGRTVGEGSLTPYIDKAFDPRVTSIILDGEMLVWDPVTERHLPFGSLKTAALDKSKKELRPRPCFKVFDLLYLNGISLIDKKLTTRKKNMKAYVSEAPGRLEYVTEYEGKTAKDVRMKMDEVMENRGEGLILKHPASKYTLNGRNVDFIKVKPEYMDNMGETVDVLVVGGKYGSGKRGGGVSSLICAVRDDRNSNDEDEDEPKYSSFVRIGSGLTFADYVWVRAKPWKPWDNDRPPAFFQTSKEGNEDKGDVYLEPEDSFIIKVKAAEIVTSDQYHLNLTMRFPRALSIRDDLGIEDCMTATELFESLQNEKKRKATDTTPAQKKRKTNSKKPVVVPQYQGADVKGIEVISQLFEGVKFVVASNPKSRTAKEDKQDLETSIYAHGGDFSQMAQYDTKMVIYDGVTATPTVIAAIRRGDLDVIRSSWIRDSIAEGKLMPLKLSYFFHATEASKEAPEYEEDTSEDKVDADMEDQSHTHVKEEEEEKVQNSEWFQLDDQPTLGREQPEDEQELDYDSETAASQDGESEPPDPDDLEAVDNNRSKEVAKKMTESHEDATPLPDEKEEKTTMGEDSAMEYDENSIFRQLCFYLDTPENAKKHEMAVGDNTKRIAEIEQRFDEIKAEILKYGGKIVDLNNPKLTHVLYDKRDESRRVELTRRTAKPKRRHVILSDWVSASIEEGALLDEAYFT
ncbi:hypothetical protein M422DRAFT_57814 [Sphaerobolus stellatus SS14]|nr:hypothetical protein M422DRAFT_57814 [Sphaerobolus stellatus SS14]